MSWFILLLSGLLEAGWAIGLRTSHGLTRPLPAALTIVAMIASFALLSVATRTIAVGTAYAIWVGIGIVITAIASALIYGESFTPARITCVALILAGIVGLKLTAPAV